ncbi:hypothetical protein ACLB2K_072386 [Fragaria x ananassa]
MISVGTWSSGFDGDMVGVGGEIISGFGGDVYSEVKHVDARAIPGWVTYWEVAPELPKTKPGFGGDEYSEVKHVDARAIPGWVTYWETAPELPKTKP